MNASERGSPVATIAANTAAFRRRRLSSSYKKRKDGRWEGRVSLTEGRRSVYGATRAEAKAKVTELQRLDEMGIASLTRDQTLETYLTRWLEDVARPAIRKSTHESYEGIIRVRILPDLGKTKLSAVTPQQIQALYKKLLESGLRPASVVRTHAVLHGALKQAMRWNLIPRNPADAVRPPTVVRQELQTLSHVQVLRLIEVAEDEALRTLYAVAATTGLRRRRHGRPLRRRSRNPPESSHRTGRVTDSAATKLGSELGSNKKRRP